MRKNIIFILLYLIVKINAQTSDYDVTAPSVSSLTNYASLPVDKATGIPNISIPFFSLPSHLKKLNLNIGISYHPNNTLVDSKASDVGLGWTLFGATSVIYRNNNQGSVTNDYTIDLFGRIGKFHFSKRTDGTYVYAKVIEDKLKVLYEEISPDIYNFKVIDENGYQYYFKTLDESAYVYTSIHSSYSKSYTSCYYLTSVEDEKGNEILMFEYFTDSYNKFNQNYKSLKIKKVTSKDFGSIHFSYTFNANDRGSFRDPYKLDVIELKNNNGDRIEKYILESSFTSLIYPKKQNLGVAGYTCGLLDILDKRKLYKILKYGRGVSYETTEIKYSNNNFDFIDFWADYSNVDPFQICFKNESENPKYLGIGLLSSIKFPNGKEVKYTFEPNQYYVDKSDYEYLNFKAPPYELMDREAQYFEDIAVIPFDYHNTNGLSQYGQFSITTNPDEIDGYSYLFYHLNIDELYTDSPFQPINGNYVVNFNITNGVDDSNGHKKYPPGIIPFTISGTGGRGNIVIKRIRYKTLPMENYSTGKGVRIKKIEYIENDTPIAGLTTQYSYQNFDGSNKTSGFLNENIDEETVVYKNVKETLGQNKGFIKYYYRTLYDVTPQYQIQDTLFFKTPEMRAANILKNGLLEKEEMYDKNNVLMKKDSIISYIHPLYSIFSTYPLANPRVIFGNTYDIVRNGIVEKQQIISSSYNPSGVMTDVSEVIKDVDDYNIIYKKNTGPDGKVMETFNTYPWAVKSSLPRFWNANIIDIPIITETRINGTTINKVEMKFDDLSHFYPTSKLNRLLNSMTESKVEVTFDKYDSKGNLLQYTTKAGIPVAIVWGYNGTQPIAKVEGITYDNLVGLGLVSGIITASDADASNPANEGALITALDNFRTSSSLSSYQISTYTYDPLIGVTSITPPSGIREIYIYDTANRLEKIVDVEGKVLKEFKYNYKN